MERPAANIQDYFDTISDAFDAHMGVGILRLQAGMDVSQLLDSTGSTYDLPTLITRDETVQSKLNGYAGPPPTRTFVLHMYRRASTWT